MVSPKPGVGNLSCTADRFETEIFFFADRPSNNHKCSAMNICYNSCELLQHWFNENLELVLPQRDACFAATNYGTQWPAMCPSRPACFAVSSLLLPPQNLQTDISRMSGMAAKFLMILWQGQGIQERLSSKTLTESLYEKYISDYHHFQYLASS